MTIRNALSHFRRPVYLRLPLWMTGYAWAVLFTAAWIVVYEWRF